MEAKTKQIWALIKKPGSKLNEFSIEQINNDIETLQKIVGGYIEVVRPFSDNRICMIVNEDGKLKQLPTTFKIGNDYIVGNAVFTSLDEDDNFESLTPEQIFNISMSLTHANLHDFTKHDDILSKEVWSDV